VVQAARDASVAPAQSSDAALSPEVERQLKEERIRYELKTPDNL
jgi:hypothetical protein